MQLPEGYAVRRLRVTDAAALAAAYDRNRDHLARWDPLRPSEFFTERGQVQSVAPLVAAAEQGYAAGLVLWHEGGTVVGRVNLNNVVRGVFQSADLGYWVDKDHLRQGLATAMVAYALGEAQRIGLHRVQAGTLVENTPSQAVLRKCGFVEFGTAARYLFIAGAWRDHVLFQRILDDRPPHG